MPVFHWVLFSYFNTQLSKIIFTNTILKLNHKAVCDHNVCIVSKVEPIHNSLKSAKKVLRLLLLNFRFSGIRRKLFHVADGSEPEN